MISALDLDLGTYEPHATHSPDRIWPETNCYVDVWVETLHAMGCDPVAAMAFTLDANFDGDQWRFYKYPSEDLRELYGIEVNEMNAWLPLDEHFEEHLGLGHLLTVEVDSWFLPDTAGAAYRREHTKTTIVPESIDREGQRVRYFHNLGYWELTGEDYVGALRLGDAVGLPPYVELVRLDDLERPDDAELRRRVDGLVDVHLARRPSANPVAAMAERVGNDLGLIAERGQEFFHRYAFGTLRQCGAWAESTATFVDWLDPIGAKASVEAFVDLSNAAKSCQFKLARVAAGRSADLVELFDRMATDWTTGYEELISARAR